jgi:hypothetical protein
LGACTTISVTSSEGHTKIDRSFGFASVSVSPEATPVVIQITSIGFLSGPAGYTAGYSNQEITTFKDDCRVIFWVKDKNQAKAVLEVVNRSKDICVHTPDQ